MMALGIMALDIGELAELPCDQVYRLKKGLIERGRNAFAPTHILFHGGFRTIFSD